MRKSSIPSAPLPETGHENIQASSGWDQAQWIAYHKAVASEILGTSSEKSDLSKISCWGRKVMRDYSSSFYAVTRFLPSKKKADVEIVYAAVRYPDEIVDTFPLSNDEKNAQLRSWKGQFERSADFDNIRQTVTSGIPVTLAGFRDVTRRHEIPDSYYRSFLQSMEADVLPKRFIDWDDLIENYIYGSATVVGYFLAHIYGANSGETLDNCLRGARSLSIALQLTNFARDVADDAVRGRCYLPERHGISTNSSLVSEVLLGKESAMSEAQLILATEAEKWYLEAACDINSFNSDSRIAIEACHNLYSKLNNKIISDPSSLSRKSLSFSEKLSALPNSKYWRLPAALLLERY